MKYVLTWWERPGGSCSEVEAAQERILSIFQQYEIPESMNITEFVVRVGEFGGYMVVETEVPTDIHKLTTIFAGFQAKLEPVLDVTEAVAAESEAIAWRNSLG